MSDDLEWSPVNTKIYIEIPAELISKEDIEFRIIIRADDDVQ